MRWTSPSGARMGTRPLLPASRRLVGLAAVAYCRAFVPSTVRGRLTDSSVFPDDLAEVRDDEGVPQRHGRALAGRAAVTYAVRVLDSDTLRVRMSQDRQSSSRSQSALSRSFGFSSTS